MKMKCWLPSKQDSRVSHIENRDNQDKRNTHEYPDNRDKNDKQQLENDTDKKILELAF